MAEQRAQRRLAAILAADVVAYSRLMGDDEAGTLAALKKLRLELIDPAIAEYQGRMVKLMGDGALVEFASVVDAVECAIHIQSDMSIRNAGIPENKSIRFRIGVNLGDIIIDGDDIYGDGVNVAARLEGEADPGGICISGDAYRQVTGKIDHAFEDLGERTLKNISAPVRAYRWCSAPVQPAVRVDSRQQIRSPSKPSIAVMPFANMSGDPKQEYFSDGITEDLITDLSKISSLSIVARNSTFAYKSRRIDLRQVAADLGVSYVVEGSVRKAGERIRVTAQLIDPATSYHLWAERYDRDLTDIFALQDEITEQIVAALEITLSESEQEKVARRYTNNLEAYDYFLRGRDQVRATNETNAQAQEMFERAIELDPGFAAAYAMLSYTHWRGWFNQWNDDSHALDRALEMAQKAVALDDDLPLARAFLGWIYVMRKEHEKAITEAQRAIALDPNLAEAYAYLGEVMNLSGKPEEGISLIEKAMRLDPHYPANYLIYLGHANWALGKYEDAIAALKRCLTRFPSSLSSHRTLAVIYSELGRIEEAKAEVAEMLKISPSANLIGQKERLPFKSEAVLRRFLDGLRVAGLPE